MPGGLVVCGVSELAVLRDLQPGWGGWGWGGQAVPRWGQRHTRVCWTQGGKLPLLQDTKEESADLLRRFAGAGVPAPSGAPAQPRPPRGLGGGGNRGDLTTQKQRALTFPRRALPLPELYPRGPSPPRGAPSRHPHPRPPRR